MTPRRRREQHAQTPTLMNARTQTHDVEFTPNRTQQYSRSTRINLHHIARAGPTMIYSPYPFISITFSSLFFRSASVGSSGQQAAAMVSRQRRARWLGGNARSAGGRPRGAASGPDKLLWEWRSWAAASSRAGERRCWRGELAREVSARAAD
jgi:hypothetical protein